MSVRLRVGISFFAAAGIAIAPVTAQSIPPGITIDSGQIEGAVSHGVLSFKGIPYAASPVGNRRWRAPQPVKPWTGVRKATQHGNDAMQKPVSGDAAPPGMPPSEDCLTINVWRPETPLPAGKKLPVLVWIHGGGYVNGGSSTPIYDGSAFARQGLVFVSFNYRLGRFGFFSHPALVAAKEGPVGNFGLMDQIAALKWVRRNIDAFGGDAAQVTIMGESAGGDSVLHLLTSPTAKGLFHRAVVMSGGGRKALLGGRKLSGGTPQNPSADQIGMNFARSVRIRGEGQEALRALRMLPADTLVGNLNMLGMFIKTVVPVGDLRYVEGPIIDRQIVLDSPGAMLKRGEAAAVPLLIGTTSADLSTSFPLTKTKLFAAFGPEADQARSLYDPAGRMKQKELIAAVGADRTMHEPARFVARQMTAAGNPVWLYRFGYVAESQRPKANGAGHASELPFLFNTLTARYGKAVTRKDEAAARTFHSYFANFAKYGDPNGGGLPVWPKYDPARSDLMLFTPDNGPLLKPDPLRRRLDLVERAADSAT